MTREESLLAVIAKHLMMANSIRLTKLGLDVGIVPLATGVSSVSNFATAISSDMESLREIINKKEDKG